MILLFIMANINIDCCAGSPQIAAAKNCIECIKNIGEYGDPFRKDTHDQWTAFHYAVYFGKKESVKTLLENENYKELLDIPDKLGWTPLHLASKFEKCDALIILLENGAKQWLLTDKGNTAYNLGSNTTKKIIDEFNSNFMECKEPYY